MSHWVSVLIDTPAHAKLGPVLSYRSEHVLTPGTLVRVPFGKREVLGLVWNDDENQATGEIDTGKIRDVLGALDGIAPLGARWQQLVTFAARYYQRSIGEVALGALPPQLRDLSPLQVQRRLQRKRTASPPAATSPSPLSTTDPSTAAQGQNLTPEQTEVVGQIEHQEGPFLLFGATGSGKTEVYLHCVQRLLAQDPTAQALVMVPEINLTPQLEARFRERFAPLYGEQALVSLHSGMTPAQRLNSWLGAHQGQARIVLGTRMAVFASMPTLRLIVVDEEHDPSYKSGEGARYSARDLAVYRARQEGAKIILGSATPSLESWHHSRPAQDGGRYLRLSMPSRIGQGALPLLRRVNMRHQHRKAVFSVPLLEAMKERLLRGEQCMVLLNRRGYAPVLQCEDCGWKSACQHCSAFKVFHKSDRTLRCHHCGFTQAVPRACPDCANPDILPIGRGTEQVEELLAGLFADVPRPHSTSPECPQGLPLRIARIDADSTRLKGSLETQLAAVHAGDVDILVGTQMIAKGHDFRRITLVAAINPDGALFSSDFRAPERLFSLLMQAAGRAGRDAALRAHSEVWVQTFQPEHPLYSALKQHDYQRFAAQQLQERHNAAMPPFSAQALIRADARSQPAAQAFLNLAREQMTQAMAQWPEWADIIEQITIYSAVPMSIQRVANVERAQMLVESNSRAVLQKFLHCWQPILHSTRADPACKGLIRWAIDVDPLLI